MSPSASPTARSPASYWADIFRPAIHRYDPKSGETKTWHPPEKLGSFALREAGGLLLAARSGLAFFDPQSGVFEIVYNPEPDLPGNILNDGKCDRKGRFWVGSMGFLTAGCLRRPTTSPARQTAPRSMRKGVFGTCSGMARALRATPPTDVSTK
ncbi:MAG: SMP-30/gluconolactonase/LRE family protein [Candidatus Rokubacteria bacterium]|nr:SMP-30/gluconolactonase/LRE family protein [Candidatus Rokubacteria bacterium]